MRKFTKYPSNYVKASADWQEKSIKVQSKMKPTLRKAYTKDLGNGYSAEVAPEYQHNKDLATWVATIYKDGHIDRFDSFSTESAAKQYVDSSCGCVMASKSSSKYPTVELVFQGDTDSFTITGKLDSAEFLHQIIKAMESNDEFAEAMANWFDPEYNDMVWEDTTYEEVAIDMVDWFKSDYREFKALESRGRAGMDGWVAISEDESITISG